MTVMPVLVPPPALVVTDLTNSYAFSHVIILAARYRPARQPDGTSREGGRYLMRPAARTATPERETSAGLPPARRLHRHAPGTMLPMKPLPIPCPADRIPNATGLDAFNAAYKAAKTAKAVYVGIERRGQQWSVKADVLTAAPQHALDDTAHDAIRAAVLRLARRGEIRPSSGLGPVHYTLLGVKNEERARELAAALHAALYGDPQPMDRAIPAS